MTSFTPLRTLDAGISKRLGDENISCFDRVLLATGFPFTTTSNPEVSESSPLARRYSLSARTVIAVSRVLFHCAPRRFFTSQFIAGSMSR